MGLTSEVYLSRPFVLKEEWQKLIKTISNYNGTLRKWKIIVINERGQIRYFIKTRCSLPATINNLSCFLLKPVKGKAMPKADHTLLYFAKSNCDVIDLINDFEIRNKGRFMYLEISFWKIYENRIKKKISFYIRKGKIIKKYNVIFSFPESILAVNFEDNKRYFYKKIPKYLEIKKIMHLLNTEVNNALLAVDTFPYLQGQFYLKQSNFSFFKHSIILGSSGCGKSKFISLLIKNIYKNKVLREKFKVVVIDPHAAMEEDIGGMGKVIDFKKQIDSINLFTSSSDEVISSVELLLDLLKALLASLYNAKLERVLRHSIYVLLTDKAFSFKNLRRLILDLEYRNALIKKHKYNLPEAVIDFFLADFNDLKTKSYGEAISPIISFIDEMEMVPAFNDKNQMEDLLSAVQDNFLTLFSLDRTKLGDKVTKTIAGLIMQQLLTIILKKEIDKHIIFIIDEVAVVQNPILARYLSEARKYNLSLVLAGQYFNQISGDLQKAIFANVVNYFIFRVSRSDALLLVDNFNMKIPLDDTKEAKIKLLTELNNRELVARVDYFGMLLPAFKARTLNYEGVPRVKRNILNMNSQENNCVSWKKEKSKFSLDGNVRLKDILIANSTSKKEILKNE